jgi:hypothetical protein
MRQKWMESLEVKDVDEKKRSIRFIATAFDVDYEGDRVHITENKKGQGLIITRGNKTPLKTWHNYKSWPIGMCQDWEKSKRKAEYSAAFFTEEINPEAERGWRIAQTGVMGDSMGFQDVVTERRELSELELKAQSEGKIVRQGMEFFESNLFEMSLTDVMANPGAVPAKETEEMVRKYLAEIVQAGGGCARKGCGSSPVPSLTQRMKDLELEIIKALNAGQSEVDKDAVQSLLGHLKDLEYILWAKDDLHQDALDEIQSWIESKAKGGK